jgi:hypothetical protein
MAQTITELQAELSAKDKNLKKVKLRTSNLHKEVLDNRKHMKTLIWQYERIVKEYRILVEEYKQNISKMFFVVMFKKIFKKEGKI